MKLKAVAQKIIPDKFLKVLKSERASKVFRVLNTIKNVVCWSLLALLVLTVVVFMTSRIRGDSPSVFGYSVFRVSSGSMEPEIMTGEVILSKSVDDVSQIAVGDVITFDGSGELAGKTITHKVIKAPYTDEGGNTMLQTKGVANEVSDNPITQDRVRAKMICKLPFLTGVFNLFLSTWGFLIFIILLLLVFFDEIVNIIKILTGHEENEEQKESIGEIIERIKREEMQKQLDEKSDENKKKLSDGKNKTKEKAKNVKGKSNKNKSKKSSKAKPKNNNSSNKSKKKKKKKGKKR